MSASFKRRSKKTLVRSAPGPRPSSSSANAEASSSPDPSSSGKHAPFPISADNDREHPPSSSESSPSPRHHRHAVKTSSSLLPGTKPWTNSLTLTSFGLREIDSFFFSSGGSNDGGSGGGGQPLQTFVALEEDRLSDDLARALCRYWCAEGVAQRQRVLLGSFLPSSEHSLELLDGVDDFVGGCDNYEGSTPDELRDFVMSLPRNLHLDKFRDRATRTKLSSAASPTAENSDGNKISSNRESISAIIEEEEEDADDDGNGNHKTLAPNKDEGLVNAWQYRKSIQDARSGISNSNNDEGDGRSPGGNAEGDGIYCHSYDLSKRMWDQFNSNNEGGGCGNGKYDAQNPLVTNTKIIDCSRALRSSSTSANHAAMEYQRQGIALFCSLYNHLQADLSTRPNSVIRLFLHRLPIGQGAVAMPLLMSKIRKDNLPVVVLATVRPWKWLSSSPSSIKITSENNNKMDTLSSLRSTTDVTLSLDSFSSLRMPPPPEFSLLQGVLTVRKCASFNVSHYTDIVTLKRPLAERFGVKRDGRKVTVQLLHLPPEEYSKGGSSTSGVRSGGGSNAVGGSGGNENSASRIWGCSSLGGGASLDF